jgi:hypothetical protein
MTGGLVALVFAAVQQVADFLDHGLALGVARSMFTVSCAARCSAADRPLPSISSLRMASSSV